MIDAQAAMKSASSMGALPIDVPKYVFFLPRNTPIFSVLVDYGGLTKDWDVLTKCHFNGDGLTKDFGMYLKKDSPLWHYE